MIKRKIPSRQCVGCGGMKEKREMLRVIKTPENAIVLDITGKKNGRGAYLCHSEECFLKAMKSKALERSLKITIPMEVYEELKKELSGLE